MTTVAERVGVSVVQQMFGLRDPRSARRIIQQAGGRKIAGRWMVAAARLDAWESMPVSSPVAFEREPINDQSRAYRQYADAALPKTLESDWWKQ